MIALALPVVKKVHGSDKKKVSRELEKKKLENIGMGRAKAPRSKLAV